MDRMGRVDKRCQGVGIRSSVGPGPRGFMYGGRDEGAVISV